MLSPSFPAPIFFPAATAPLPSLDHVILHKIYPWLYLEASPGATPSLRQDQPAGLNQGKIIVVNYRNCA